MFITDSMKEQIQKNGYALVSDGGVSEEYLVIPKDLSTLNEQALVRLGSSYGVGLQEIGIERWQRNMERPVNEVAL